MSQQKHQEHLVSNKTQDLHFHYQPGCIKCSCMQHAQTEGKPFMQDFGCAQAVPRQGSLSDSQAAFSAQGVAAILQSTSIFALYIYLW